jgi:hypothetical protein
MSLRYLVWKREENAAKILMITTAYRTVLLVINFFDTVGIKNATELVTLKKYNPGTQDLYNIRCISHCWSLKKNTFPIGKILNPSLNFSVSSSSLINALKTLKKPNNF